MQMLTRVVIVAVVVYLSQLKITVKINMKITSTRESTRKQYHCLFPLWFLRW